MAGKPSVVTQEVVERLCACIAEGQTVRQIAAGEGMPSASSIYLALSADSAIAEQYARAREAQLARWEDELLEIADDASNDWMMREGKLLLDGDHIARAKVRIDTRKWIMSKRLPKKYGERLETVNDTTITYVATLPDVSPSVEAWEKEARETLQ